jgi:hypothetical protein
MRFNPKYDETITKPYDVFIYKDANFITSSFNLDALKQQHPSLCLNCIFNKAFLL